MGTRSKATPPREGERRIRLNLPYLERDLEETTITVQNGQPVTERTVLTAHNLTHRLLAFAVQQQNRDGLGKKDGRMWARIQRAMDNSTTTAILSPEQFEWLCDQVDNAKFPSQSASAASLLWDQFDAVRLGSRESVDPKQPQTP